MKPTAPLLQPIQLYEPDALLAKALVQALPAEAEVTILPALPAEAGAGLLIVGGPQAAAASQYYPSGANILVLNDTVAATAYPQLTKPFRIGAFTDLALRLARRLPVLQLGDAQLLPQLRQFQRNGQQIALTEKEVDILLFLAGAEKPVKRERLLEEVWGYNQGVTTHTLETHIYRLRQKIERDPEAPSILKTVVLAEGGSGYTVDRS